MVEAIKRADVIFPLAALVGAPLCDERQEEAIKINERWFDQLQDFLDDQIVIYPNTNSGYGSTGPEICDETTHCEPLSLYGTTKLNAENRVLEHNRSTVFRLATVFGISHRQRMDLLVNNLVYTAMRDRKIEVFDGHFRRNYVHVDDVVAAFWHAVQNESMRGEVYNLGNDEANMTKLELVQKICEVTGASYDIIEGRTDPDKRDYLVSSQKLYDTGFSPKHSLQYGIEQMIHVCRENWRRFEDPNFMSMCRNY